MVALGVAALWAGYYLTMYGYCLVRGYDVTFTALAHTTWPLAVVQRAGITAGNAV